MSIFKDTFRNEITGSLVARQEALVERTPTAIQYYNSRNAWIRMSSAVNVLGSNELANNYILQGGTLYNGQLRSGVGTGSQAYSTTTPGREPNRLGIRPMPGITGIEIKSLGAYGSLRQVTVSFVAWDIRQLEDLELLYMRPGYTVLVEWGWIPYLKNDKTLSSLIQHYDIVNPAKDLTKEKIFIDLYDTAVKTYGGNYDAMYGYVKNYGWSARTDGGYDCTTEIISIGEVMESLKVNYAPLDAINTIVGKGGLISSLKGVETSLSSDDLKKYYSKNILAGLFYELWSIGHDKKIATDAGGNYLIRDYDKKGNAVYYDLFGKLLNIIGGPGDASTTGTVGASDEQIYITLETLCNILNTHVTFADSKGKESFVKCSVLDRKYAVNNTTINPLTGEGYLLCLAHPLQLSVDPTICVIKNKTWPNGFTINPDTLVPNNLTDPNLITFNSKLSNEQLESVLGQLYYVSIPTKKIKDKQAVVDYLKKVTQGDPDTIKALTKLHYKKLKDPNYKVNKPKYVDLISVAIDEGDNIDNTKLNKTLSELGVAPQISLFTFLSTPRYTNLETSQINETFGTAVESTKSDPVVTQQEELNKAKKSVEEAQSTAIKNLAYLKNIKRPYFYQDKEETELGIIGNIYVNVNYLFRLALDNNLESSDTKEKNDINLYNFLKTILSDISSATGNINNLDLFIDPIQGDTTYIIDVNYVDTKKQLDVYKEIFQLEVHNLKSTVRSYKLESQIFPDQATTIAIGAQVGGGAMATDNNTMLDFNRGLEDRIIPKKEDPTTDPNQNNTEKVKSQIESISTSLNSLYEYFGELSYNKAVDADFDTEEVGDYKNALRDLINFFKNLTKSNIKNRAIIPTKLSLTMDGIGGLVIGHLFKIPEDLLPKGYRGLAGVGSKLGYVITGIGHSIKDNDWTTNIDSQTIILDEPQGKISFSEITKINPETGATETKPLSEIADITAGKAGNVSAMKIAGNAVFRVNGGQKALCARYTYAIAFAYNEALAGRTPSGNLFRDKGNAGDKQYRDNLIGLGYKMTYLGVKSKSELLSVIKNTKWNIGDIVNYRSTTVVSNIRKNNFSNLFGHTQIYTGAVLDTSKGTAWASSFGWNYNTDMVYNSVNSNSWEIYVFQK